MLFGTPRDENPVPGNIWALFLGRSRMLRVRCSEGLRVAGFSVEGMGRIIGCWGLLRER